MALPERNSDTSEESRVIYSPHGLSVRMRIPADLEYLCNAVLTLRGICEHLALSHLCTNRIILALEESLLNAIEHAYQEEKGHVDLEFSFEDSELTLIVEDFGCGIPEGSLNPLSTLEQILCDRGRGLPILNGIPDKIVFEQPNGKGTRARMLFNIGF